MKILVIGGSGFVRARLIPRLADDRHEVFAPRGPPHRIKSES
jgi:uncharacterized protein YbjT (DUF2867 family)